MTRFQKYLTQYSAYFGDLRRRLVLLVRVFGITFVAGFFISSPLIHFFVRYISIQNVLIVTSSPFQLLDLAMSIGFFFASVVTIPVAVYQLYSFLSPGLLPKEKRVFMSLVPVAIFLFFFGFAYGFSTLYMAMQMIAQVNVSLGVVNYWDIGRFASEIVLTSSLLGLTFEFPIVVTFLIRLGILSVDFLRSKRRHAIIVIFVFVSLLPPTDGLSLVLMATPLVVIYEATIWIHFKKKKHSTSLSE